MNYTKSLLLLLLLCLLPTLTTWSQAKKEEKELKDPELLTIKVQAGQTINAIFRAYQFKGNSCDTDCFYRENGLKKDDFLVAGEECILPIYKYEYNNSSIRTTIGLIKDWTRAVRIQKYNEAMHKAGIKKRDYRDDRILWVPYSELHCVVKEPKRKHNRDFPIFGKKYREVPLKSTKLLGNVFYIVAGHGGSDVGAVGNKENHQLCEDEYAYDVALRLCRNLVAHGAIAYMITRDVNDGIRDGKYLGVDKDEYCWGNQIMFSNQKRRLRQRAGAINKLYQYHKNKGVKHQRAVMIHIDSRSRSAQTDIFFYYYPGDWAGKTTAKTLQKTMRQKYEQYQKGRGYNGSVTARDLHMIRETKSPSVYIELGNIRHHRDQERFIRASNRQHLANWLFEGLMKDAK